MSCIDDGGHYTNNIGECKVCGLIMEAVERLISSFQVAANDPKITDAEVRALVIAARLDYGDEAI